MDFLLAEGWLVARHPVYVKATEPVPCSRALAADSRDGASVCGGMCDCSYQESARLLVFGKAEERGMVVERDRRSASTRSSSPAAGTDSWFG